MNSQFFKRYYPEIAATVLLVIYTIVRTFVVAYGVSPVSDVSWMIFLAIEIVTTIPYVWAMGYIIRNSYKGAKTIRPNGLFMAAILIAAGSLLAPYVYLAAYGALNSRQGIFVCIGLVVVFTIPSIVRTAYKIRHRR